jgi:hypothetical protein
MRQDNRYYMSVAGKGNDFMLFDIGLGNLAILSPGLEVKNRLIFCSCTTVIRKISSEIRKY